MNTVSLIGRLTADPQSRTGDSHQCTAFRLAVSRPGSDTADFVDVVTFDKLAATCAEWLTKGREVAVVGKLRLNEWTAKDGERRSRLQVVADSVQFLGAATRDTNPAADEPAGPADRPALGRYRKRTA